VSGGRGGGRRAGRTAGGGLISALRDSSAMDCSLVARQEKSLAKQLAMLRGSAQVSNERRRPAGSPRLETERAVRRGRSKSQAGWRSPRLHVCGQAGGGRADTIVAIVWPIMHLQVSRSASAEDVGFWRE